MPDMAGGNQAGLSEVKRPVMDALKRSDFMEHFKGRVFLSQFEAVSTLSAEAKYSDASTGSRALSRGRGGIF